MSKTVGVILALQDKCSPQLDKIAKKLGISTDEAKKLHNQVNRLSKQMGQGLKNAATVCAAGIAAVSAAATVMVNKAVESGDRIDKLSQKMSMSRQTFQELDYVFSQNGADISMMQTGMAKLSKAMEGARTGTKANVKTFQALGISLRDNNGQLKTTENVMFEAISRLQKMPEGAQKTALALQLFGKSATELQPLLNGNAKSVDELRQKFNDLGMGMSDEQVDAAVKFKDTMDTIQRTFGGLVNQIGASLLPSLQKVADQFIENMPQIKATVIPILQGIINATSFLIEHFNLLLPVIAGTVAAFTAFKTISTVISIVQFLQAAIEAVTVAQGIWNAVMLANPIGAIAIGIGVVVGVVIALWKNWDKVTAGARKAFEVMKKAVNTINPFKNSQNNTSNNMPKHATGTNYSHGGYALVGERGPEIVGLNQGARVYSNSDTQKALSKNVVVNLNIAGNVIGNREFINSIKFELGKELSKAMAV